MMIALAATAALSLGLIADGAIAHAGGGHGGGFGHTAVSPDLGTKPLRPSCPKDLIR